MLSARTEHRRTNRKVQCHNERNSYNRSHLRCTESGKQPAIREKVAIIRWNKGFYVLVTSNDEVVKQKKASTKYRQVSTHH